MQIYFDTACFFSNLCYRHHTTMLFSRYLGAVIGRTCDRIGGGKFSLGGTQYQLVENDIVGASCLHGGERGWDKCVWEAEVDRERGTITMAYMSKDGEEGYPGDVIAVVTYSVVGQSVKISYQAMSTKHTIINITNHSYFNLGNSDDIKGIHNI